jgi:hypothetical protein
MLLKTILYHNSYTLRENIYLDDGTLIDTIERRRTRRQLAGGSAY